MKKNFSHVTNHEQNGISKKRNRIIIKVSRTMSTKANMPL